MKELYLCLVKELYLFLVGVVFASGEGVLFVFGRRNNVFLQSGHQGSAARICQVAGFICTLWQNNFGFGVICIFGRQCILCLL